MSMNNHQVAHVWANRSKPSGRSSNGNFHFDGDTIYSYSTPIGKLYAACVLVTSHNYSTTTQGKHKSAIRRALAMPCFYVPSIGATGGRSDDRNNKPDHAVNLKHFQGAFDRVCSKWRRVREPQYCDRSAKRIATDARDYAMHFGLKGKAWGEMLANFETTASAIYTARNDARLKFIIKDTFACWVTWSYEIEADTAEAALDKYQDEQPASTLPPEIGDVLDGYDRGTTVEPA